MEEIEKIITQAVNRHLVIHVQTDSREDRINLLAKEAADEIVKYWNSRPLVMHYDVPVLDDVEVEQLPILVGHLNRAFGYNGYKPIPAGESVYLFEDRYFFNAYLNNSDVPVKHKFLKGELKPYINFL